MPRRALAAGLLAVLIALAGLAPGVVPQVAASSCSGWTSETTPPATIHVYRHVSGAVDAVDFKVYGKNVLSREWIGSWTTESLRSGALAVKNYAWYQVLHWRGGVNADGDCFDVRDDTQDQVYDPTKPTWDTAAAAVDDTWLTLATKAGHIFPTYYNAGAVNEACGSNANGWKAYQWGTQACGLIGESASQIILTYYYPGVTVTNAPPPAGGPTPSPSPTATPTPSATPPPSASATASPVASSTPGATPRPTPQPTATPRPTPAPTPTPTPLSTPPPNQQLPGGGQAGVTTAAAPPPPPPANPKPVVAKPDTPAAPEPVVRSRRDTPLSGPPEWPSTTPDRSSSDRAWLIGGGGVAVDVPARQEDMLAADPRLGIFRSLVAEAAERLLRSLDALTRNSELADLLQL